MGFNSGGFGGKKSPAKGYSQYAKDAAESVSKSPTGPSIALSKKYATPATGAMKNLINRNDDEEDDDPRKAALKRRMKKLKDRKKP